MEIDIRSDDTEILLDEVAAPPGDGRAGRGALGACSMVWRGFVSGKQTPSPVTSMYKNSEMETGQDKTCGPIEEVKKHELRWCHLSMKDSGADTPPSPPVWVTGVGLSCSGNCVVDCMSRASPCSQKGEGAMMLVL